jgi:hypothetical protein
MKRRKLKELSKKIKHRFENSTPDSTYADNSNMNFNIAKSNIFLGKFCFQ